MSALGERKILRRLKQIKEILMSWQDSLNKHQADVTSMFGRVNDHLTSLQSKIDTLTQQLANTDIPADAQATLDALDQQVNNFDMPTPPPAPTSDPNPTPAPAPGA